MKSQIDWLLPPILAPLSIGIFRKLSLCHDDFQSTGTINYAFVVISMEMLSTLESLLVGIAFSNSALLQYFHQCSDENLEQACLFVKKLSF